MHTFPLPLAFPSIEPLAEGATLLAADVGGTKTDLALFAVADGRLKLLKEVVFPSKKFRSLAEMAARFNGQFPRPQRLSIAFAGPVQDGKAKATNLDWSIDVDQLRRELGIAEIWLLNDLEAEAYGLAGLRAEELVTVYAGGPASAGNAAIIAPGTGLGEAGLYWDGNALHPFATEGGHTDFAPRDAFDWELLLYLQNKYCHVSWERLVTGPGIEHIFRFLRDVKKWEVPDILHQKIKKYPLAAAIGTAAREDCPVCVETLRLFVRYLAIEASNLALKLKATGGVFIGGGIVPKIWNDYFQEVFLHHFFRVGRLQPLIESVPVQIILNPRTAMLGAALYGSGLRSLVAEMPAVSVP